MRKSWFRWLSLALCVLPLTSSAVAQSDVTFQGSVTSAASSAQPLALSLDDALQRGLRSNLGLIDSQQSSRHANGASIAARSVLLPNLNSGLTETVQQVDLAAF